MAESSLLSKDERLTPSIDEVMAVCVFYEIPPTHTLYITFFGGFQQFNNNVAVLWLSTGTVDPGSNPAGVPVQLKYLWLSQ